MKTEMLDILIEIQSCFSKIGSLHEVNEVNDCIEFYFDGKRYIIDDLRTIYEVNSICLKERTTICHLMEEVMNLHKNN